MLKFNYKFIIKIHLWIFFFCFFFLPYQKICAVGVGYDIVKNVLSLEETRNIKAFIPSSADNGRYRFLFNFQINLTSHPDIQVSSLEKLKLSYQSCHLPQFKIKAKLMQKNGLGSYVTLDTLNPFNFPHFIELAKIKVDNEDILIWEDNVPAPYNQNKLKIYMDLCFEKRNNQLILLVSYSADAVTETNKKFLLNVEPSQDMVFIRK